MLEKDKSYERTIDGVTLKAKVDACCWMYANYPLQCSIRMSGKGGEAHIVNKALNFQNATDTDVEKLLESVKISKCKHCDNFAFDPTTVKTNRDGACENCFVEAIMKDYNEEMAKENAETVKKHIEMYAKGFRFVVMAWVHPQQGGDDYQIDVYFNVAPKAKDIQATLKKQRSIQTDDYSVYSIDAEGNTISVTSDTPS